MIEIRDLHKSFSKRTVLEGITFTCAPGAVTGLIGPNSCGKSTLMKSILGLVIPDKGTISFKGRSIESGSSYRSDLGYVPQIVDFPDNLSVSEVLDFLENLREKKAVKRQELINRLDLRSHLGHSFGQLSGGARQKLGVVCALMFDSAHILLDEPSASLDPVTAVSLREIVAEEARAGKTVLMVSHNLNEIQQLAKSIVFLLDGNVRFSGTTESFLGNGRDLESALVSYVKERQIVS